MSFLGDLFGSSTQETGTVKTKLPEWVTSAAKNNLDYASKIAERPYQAYGGPRIASFSGDSTKGQNLLRGYTPGNYASVAQGGQLPRQIDEIGQGGTVDAYMDPFLGQVLDRTGKNIRRSTDMAQQGLAKEANMEGAFGDAQYGVARSELERNAAELYGDKTAELSSAAYDNAQRLRSDDINRILSGGNQDFEQKLRYIDALLKSGNQQEQKTQSSLDLAKGDFDAQNQHPTEMLNLLMSALQGTPYGKTQTSTQPGPSVAGQILGALGSLGSLFF